MRLAGQQVRIAHGRGRGNPLPVEKAAPLTYEAVIKMAETRVAQTPGQTREEALVGVCSGWILLANSKVPQFGYPTCLL